MMVDSALQLGGLHHVTCVSADAQGNHAFYTQVLGMRLVKKTVNQDDPSAYHLFYADGLASPGSDITFFEWPVARERRGTNAVTRTALRISGADAFVFWVKRFAEHGVRHSAMVERDGRATLDFEDGEGQRLSLIDDGGIGPSHSWSQSPVPAGFQIRGLGPVIISVRDAAATRTVLEQVMSMVFARSYSLDGTDVSVLAMGEGGAHAEVHLTERRDLPPSGQGAGAVHHVAFRTTLADYDAWTQRLQAMRMPSSGPVDRFWFRSLYFREPNGILFELATDEPGFATDEAMDALGTTLSLPPKLEPHRAAIEAALKPV